MGKRPDGGVARGGATHARSGSLADYAGNKIKFFLGFFLTGLVLCFAQAIPMGAMPFLVVYVLCTIGLNSSMTFYDAMLPDITIDDRMDTVSSSGYAWGYIGSCVPFIVCILLILVGPSALGLDMLFCVQVSFIITGIWWLAFTVPLVRTYKQRYAKELAPGETFGGEVVKTIRGLGTTMRRIAEDRAILIYMIAFFFYIDGVHTVISMATTYGTSLGLDRPRSSWPCSSHSLWRSPPRLRMDRLPRSTEPCA